MHTTNKHLNIHISFDVFHLICCCCRGCCIFSRYFVYLCMCIHFFVFCISLRILFYVIVKTLFLYISFFLPTLALNIPFMLWKFIGVLCWKNKLMLLYGDYYSFCRAFCANEYGRRVVKRAREIEREENYYSSNHRIIFHVLILFPTKIWILFCCTIAYYLSFFLSLYYENTFGEWKTFHMHIAHMRWIHSTVMIQTLL